MTGPSGLAPDEEIEQLAYETAQRLATEAAVLNPSRRTQRHGRKHNKARDKTPYDRDGVAFAPKLAGKGRGATVTRTPAPGVLPSAAPPSSSR